MIITCHACTGGTTSAGTPCGVCGGDGEIDLTDAAFRSIKYGARISLTGQVWSEMLDKLDSIIAEQAAIREDLTAGLLQIWNKVKDLD